MDLHIQILIFFWDGLNLQKVYIPILIIIDIGHFRGRKFYGKSITEGVQHPTETMYMPHYIHHAAYNLDQTVAVGDNPFFATAIEESVFELIQNGAIGYGMIVDKSVIHIHKG